MRFLLGDVVSIPLDNFGGAYPANLVFDGKVMVRIIAKHKRLPYYSVEVHASRGVMWNSSAPHDWDTLKDIPDQICTELHASTIDSVATLEEPLGSCPDFHPNSYKPAWAKKSEPKMEDFKLGDVIKIPQSSLSTEYDADWKKCTDAEGFVKTRILATSSTGGYILQVPDGYRYKFYDYGSFWEKLPGAAPQLSACYYNKRSFPAGTVKVTCKESHYNPNFKYQLGETVWIDGHEAMIVARAKSTHNESRYIVEKTVGSFSGITMPTAQGTILQHHVRKKDGFWTWIEDSKPNSICYGLRCADDNIQTKPPTDGAQAAAEQKKDSHMNFAHIDIGDEVTFNGHQQRAIVFGKTDNKLIVESHLGQRVTDTTWLSAKYLPGKEPSGQTLLVLDPVSRPEKVNDADNVVNIGDRVSTKIGRIHVNDAVVYAISKDRMRVAIGHEQHGNASERTPPSEWDVGEWYEESDFNWKYMQSMVNVKLEASQVRKNPRKPQVGDVWRTSTGHNVTIVAYRKDASDYLCVFEPGIHSGWLLDQQWRNRNTDMVLPEKFHTGEFNAYFFAKSSFKTLISAVGDSEKKEEKVQVEVKKNESFVQMCKDDMEEAAYRGAARQITKGTRAILVMFLKSQGAKKSWIKAIVEMSESDWGCSMISWGLGVALTYAPHLRDNAHCMILAKEFRVEGLGSAISQVGDVFRKQFEPMILAAISNLPAPPAEKLRILNEENKARRVADVVPTAVTNEVKAEQEAIATEAALKEEKKTATATV